MASSVLKYTRTAQNKGKTVTIAGIKFGGRQLVSIAGPCSVESYEQFLQTALRVKKAGARMLRGGIYKPRTSPYSFQGLEENGIEVLAAVKKKTGLPVVTEVLCAEHIELLRGVADAIQIGSRNMHNYHLLKAAGKSGIPVLLKRGMCATLEEFLLAAEYILAAGNPNVLLCERGIRTFEPSTRFTFDINIVAYLKQRTWLPVIADASHGTGVRALVAPVSCAAIAAGADGLITEVHYHPDKAVSDAAQTLSPTDFAKLMKTAKPIAEAVGRTI